MANDDLNEELARRDNDRYGNAPLRRPADPAKVAAHLATAVVTHAEREHLRVDMRAAAKIDKQAVKDFIQTLATDLDDLAYNGSEPTIRKGQDWVKQFLADNDTGESSLIVPKKVDNFTTESPIRAFTEFRVDGLYAVGKGFRPSMAHLTRYLDAMETKEGWRLSQLILPTDDASDPTIIFRKQLPPLTQTLEVRSAATDIAKIMNAPYGKTPAPDLGAPHDIPIDMMVASNYGIPHEVTGIYTNGMWCIVTRMDGEQVTRKDPLRGLPLCWRLDRRTDWIYSKDAVDDVYKAFADTMKSYQDAGNMFSPDTAMFEDDEDMDNPDQRPAVERLIDEHDAKIHPQHYDGTQCMDIGERLSGNGYQILKYVWRLGKKDDAVVELGKAINYLDHEIALLGLMGGSTMIFAPNQVGMAFVDRADWFDQRISGQPVFTQDIARALWAGYNITKLQEIRGWLTEKRFEIANGRGLAL